LATITRVWLMAAMELQRHRGRVRRAGQAARLAHTLHLQLAPELRGGAAWKDLLEQELRWSDEFRKLNAQLEKLRPQVAKNGDPASSAITGYSCGFSRDNGLASHDGGLSKSCSKGNSHIFWTESLGPNEECLWLSKCSSEPPCQEARAHRERCEVQQLEEATLVAGGDVAVHAAGEGSAASNLAEAHVLMTTGKGTAAAPDASGLSKSVSTHRPLEVLSRSSPGSAGSSGCRHNARLQCLDGGPATTIDEVREVERAKTDRLREQMRAAELRLAREGAAKYARTAQSHRTLRLATLRNELVMETRLADESAARRRARAQAVTQTAFEVRNDDADWLSQCVENARATVAAERLRLRVAFSSDDDHGHPATASADLQRQFENTLRAIAEGRERLQACRVAAVGGVAPRPVETVCLRFNREQMEALAERYTQALEADAGKYSTVTVRTPQGLAWARVEGEFP